MLPRSAVGRAIVKAVDTGAEHEQVEQSATRWIRLHKKSRDALLGVRFGIHPVSKQVRLCVCVSPLPEPLLYSLSSPFAPQIVFTELFPVATLSLSMLQPLSTPNLSPSP